MHYFVQLLPTEDHIDTARDSMLATRKMNSVLGLRNDVHAQFTAMIHRHSQGRAIERYQHAQICYSHLQQYFLKRILSDCMPQQSVQDVNCAGSCDF